MSEKIKTDLVTAALSHVAFDGWSAATFDNAVTDCGIDPALARAICPRGAVDLAVAFHRHGDDLMREAISHTDLSELKIRERITFAVKRRLELCPDKEAVRRGSTLFALPQHAATGSRLIWETADAIWESLGDSSRDMNWYTKRATLSAVYAATVLYWLGDESEGNAATWAFLDRRIENVMQFEKVKAGFRNSPLGKSLQRPLESLSRVKAPSMASGLPGRWRP